MEPWKDAGETLSGQFESLDELRVYVEDEVAFDRSTSPVMRGLAPRDPQRIAEFYGYVREAIRLSGEDGITAAELRSIFGIGACYGSTGPIADRFNNATKRLVDEALIEKFEDRRTDAKGRLRSQNVFRWLSV
jgi:hypothetical protein